MAQHKRPAYTEQKFEHLKGLDDISDDQINEHLQLYAGYVKQVNALGEELAELRERGRASGTDHEFAELTRRLGFEYNGMILHEYLERLRRETTPRVQPSGTALPLDPSRRPTLPGRTARCAPGFGGASIGLRVTRG